LKTDIRGKTINEVVNKSLQELIYNGYRTKSRNGDINTVYNAFVTLDNPKARHLSLVGRKNNIFATIAETFWVFAGSNKIDPYLSFFLPRAKDFSDDGETWRGGYPERIFANGQLDDVIEQFRNEGIYTRRAVLVISDPNLDTKENLLSKYGIDQTKDRPCNMIIDFFITPDKRLHMNVKSRSGDVIWGFGSINIFEWTFLQEMVLQFIQDEIDPKVTLGTYNHHVTNLHLYDFNGAQGYEVLRNPLDQKLGLNANDEIEFPVVEEVHDFFQKLVEFYSGLITAEKLPSYGTDILDLNELFEDFRLSTEGNILYEYACLVLAYIMQKRYRLAEEEFGLNIEVMGSDEFIQSIDYSPFRKFNFERVYGEF
jgi:thymidylate synthase